MKRLFTAAIVLSSLMLSVSVLPSCNNAKQEPKTEQQAEDSNLSGVLTGSKTLSADKEYFINGPLIIEDGASLTIPAGTHIKARKGFSSYILVLQGGKIFVNGTAEKPVVMTADSPNAQQGYWGGLIINGRAPLTKSPSGEPQKGSTEINTNYLYGGNDPHDNSGVIRYLVVEYPGARSSADVEHNGLTLNGVGDGTVIENVMVKESADDGVELFGGTVNIKNLLVVNSDDDMFDFTQGFKGQLTNCYGVWEKGFSSTESDPRGIEGDGNLDGGFADHLEQSACKFTNITFDLRLDPVSKEDADYKKKSMQDVIKIRRGASAVVANALVKGTGTVEDLVDCTDKKGDAAASTNISITNALSNPITGKLEKPGANHAVINIVAGNTGCAVDNFAWTGYNF